MQRTPREYGALRASSYTKPIGGTPGRAPTVEIGFTSAYAVYVHENMEMKLRGKARPSGLGVYWGPRGRSKFLESALTDLRPEIIQIVAGKARIR